MMVVVAPVMVMAVMMVMARHNAHVRDIPVMMPAQMVMVMMSSVVHLDHLTFSCNRCGRKRGRLAGRDIDAEAKARAEHRQHNEFSQHVSSRRALGSEQVSKTSAVVERR
jgi:hypothetical protein